MSITEQIQYTLFNFTQANGVENQLPSGLKTHHNPRGSSSSTTLKKKNQKGVGIIQVTEVYLVI